MNPQLKVTCPLCAELIDTLEDLVGEVHAYIEHDGYDLPDTGYAERLLHSIRSGPRL